MFSKITYLTLSFEFQQKNYEIILYVRLFIFKIYDSISFMVNNNRSSKSNQFEYKLLSCSTGFLKSNYYYMQNIVCQMSKCQN